MTELLRAAEIRQNARIHRVEALQVWEARRRSNNQLDAQAQRLKLLASGLRRRARQSGLWRALGFRMRAWRCEQQARHLNLRFQAGEELLETERLLIESAYRRERDEAEQLRNQAESSMRPEERNQRWREALLMLAPSTN